MRTIEGLLPQARRLVFANRSDSVEAVIQTMVGNKVSLVPILDGGVGSNRNNRGVVRRKDLFALMHEGIPITTLDQVIDDPLPEVLEDAELSEAMRKLDSGASALLVRNSNKELDRLLTPRSVAESLHVYSQQFRLIDVLESTIREVLKRSFGDEVEFPGKSGERITKSVEMMEFGEYRVAFSEHWDEISLKAERSLFLKWLEEANTNRNRIMHFRFRPNDDDVYLSFTRLTTILQQRNADNS